MTDTTYEGWTNRATWCVKLWMDNEQPTQEHFQGLAKSALENAEPTEIFTKEQSATYSLSETIKAEHEEMAEAWMPSQAGVFSDLLNGALASVNWDEIARSLIESAKENA